MYRKLFQLYQVCILGPNTHDEEHWRSDRRTFSKAVIPPGLSGCSGWPVISRIQLDLIERAPESTKKQGRQYESWVMHVNENNEAETQYFM